MIITEHKRECTTKNIVPPVISISGFLDLPKSSYQWSSLKYLEEL
jgi:hypothetical protein